MSKRYMAIIGDVVGSRKIGDRERFQSKLQNACDHVNSTFARDLYAKLKITKGIDEVSAVLTNIENLYKIINMISEAIHPNFMRFVTIYGSLDIALDSKDAAKIDGVALHRATEIISNLKRTRDLVTVQIMDELIDQLLNSHMNLVFFLKRAWTKRQFDVVTLYKKLGNQEEVAQKLRIIQPTVSKILKAADYDEIFRAEQTINEVLREYQKRLRKEIV